MTVPDPMLTLAEAADRWNVSPDWVRDQIAGKRLIAYRSGRRIIRVRQSDMDGLFRRTA